MKFDKTQFSFDGDYLMYYGDESGERHFVARFKYNKKNRPGFVSFLIKNFTVEEYFKALVVDKIAPAHILESKGYLPKVVKDLLKSQGYEPTEVCQAHSGRSNKTLALDMQNIIDELLINSMPDR